MNVTVLRKVCSWLPSLLLSIGAAVIIFHTTRMGIGLDPDSIVYIGTARSILSGRGISVPFTSYSDPGDFAPMIHFPPLYPLFLAGLGLLGIDLQMAARTLGAILFSLNVFLVSVIVYQYTRHWWTAATAAFLVLFPMDMLVAHSMAWSEPLFIFLTLITVLLLIRYVESQNLFCLLGASLSASLGLLCRYIGVSWLLVGGVVSPLWTSGPLNRKLRNVGTFSVCGSLLTAPCFLRNLWVSGMAINRPIVFHPVSSTTLLNGLRTVGKWLLPAVISGPVLGGGLVIGLIMVTLTALRAGPSRKERGMLGVLSLFICFYTLSLLVSISFVDYYTPLDERILAPVYVLAVPLTLCALYTLATSPMLRPIRETHLWNSNVAWTIGSILLIGGGIGADLVGFGSESGFGTKQLSLVLLGTAGLVRIAAKKLPLNRLPMLPIARTIVLAWFLGWFIYPGLDWVIHVDDGRGFSAQVWKNSPVIAAVRNWEVPIYSNGADVIYTGKPTKALPFSFFPGANRPNPNFYQELRAFGMELQRSGGIFVFVEGLDRDYLPSEQELLQYLNLRLVQALPDGRIYQAARP